MFESKTVSHQGCVRESNEDSYASNESLGLWVVADGVGGNVCGELASQLASQTLERKIRQGYELAEGIVAANAAIVNAVAVDEGLTGMATTIVACRFDAYHQFQLAWVGDSRAYLLDQSGICQLSSDHNLANSLFKSGAISAEEALTHSGQHELTQALGQLTLDKIPMNLGELHDQDYLLLCTDGLTGVLSDQEIYQVVIQSNTIESACDCLLEMVLDRGAPDNVTFSLIQYQEKAPVIKASDFNASSYRLPFDQRPYLKHLGSRTMLLALVFISIIVLFLFV